MNDLKKDLQSIVKSLKSLTQITEKIALQSIVKSLKSLTQATEGMAKKLETMEKDRAGARPKARPSAGAKSVKKSVVKKPAGVKRTAKKAPVPSPVEKGLKASAADIVVGMIRESEGGLTTAQIMEKTGYGKRKIWDIVNRAKREGKIMSAGRGIYTKA